MPNSLGTKVETSSEIIYAARLRTHKLTISRNMQYEYFKQIDTPNKAYFLGLFHADGSCTKRQRGSYEELRFQISLQERDASILEAFCKDVDLDLSRLKHYKSARANESNYAKLYIADKRFTQYLVDLKEESLISRIPNNLMPHFIRGFFDGDGSIYVRRNNKKIFYYAFSFTCFKWIKNTVISNLPFEVKARPDKRSENLTTIESNKQGNIIALFNYMYLDDAIKLDRKYLKFKEAYAYASTTSSNERRAK
jgi:hypothetical protein